MTLNIVLVGNKLYAPLSILILNTAYRIQSETGNRQQKLRRPFSSSLEDALCHISTHISWVQLVERVWPYYLWKLIYALASLIYKKFLSWPICIRALVISKCILNVILFRMHICEYVNRGLVPTSSIFICAFLTILPSRSKHRHMHYHLSRVPISMLPLNCRQRL